MHLTRDYKYMGALFVVAYRRQLHVSPGVVVTMARVNLYSGFGAVVRHYVDSWCAVLSADTFPPAVLRAATEVATNGDHWENVLNAIHSQDQNMW